MMKLIQLDWNDLCHSDGLVAQWIRRLPTEQEIPGSIPGKVATTFHYHLIFGLSSPKKLTADTNAIQVSEWFSFWGH